MSGPERRAVVSATALFAGLLVVWAMLAPSFRAADEPMHVSTVMRLAQTGTFPPPGRALLNPSVLSASKWVNYFGSTGSEPTVERPPDLAHPPSMRQLSGPDPERPRTAVDQMTQHPPGYYLLMAGVVDLLQLDDASPSGLVLALRLASSLLLLPLPYLCFRLSRQLRLSHRIAAASAFLPSAWMQFVHVSATVNNGALLALATSVTVVLIVPVVQGDVRLRRALALGAALAVALFTKGFALALLPTLPFAYLVAARRAGVGPALRGLLVAGLATLPGLWWWVLNLVRYGAVQPKGMADRVPTLSTPPPVSQWFQSFSETFVRTLWFGLGWAEGNPPPWLYLSLSAIFFVALIVGTWRLRRQAAALLLMHMIWLGALAIVVIGSLGEFERSGQVRAAQGRYIQVAVIIFAVLVMAAISRFVRLSHLTPGAVTVLAFGGLGYGLQHFWAPTPGHGFVLDRVFSMFTWWPAGSIWLAAAGLALALAGALAGTVALRSIPLQPVTRARRRLQPDLVGRHA